jgi:hypothetical protein
VVEGTRQQECREQGGGRSTLQGTGLAVLRRQYKHEGLVYIVFYYWDESVLHGDES